MGLPMKHQLYLLLLFSCGVLPAQTDIPEPQKNLEHLALEAEQKENWEEAAVYLDRLLQDGRPSEPWLKRRIHAAEESKDWEACVHFRTALLKRFPDRLNLRIDLADDLQRTERGTEAVLLMEDAVSHPETREAALRVVLVLQEREERWLDAALTAERLSKDISLTDRRMLLQRASRHREKTGDLQGAFENMEKALDGLTLSENEQRILSRLRAIQTGEIKNVDDAVNLLRRHDSADFRFRAVLYLAQERFPRDVGVFLEALDDSDVRIQRICAQELSQRGGPQDAPYLAILLPTANRELRLDLIRGLGGIGTQGEIPALLEFLDPEDREAFRAVRQSLERISGQSFGLSLDPSLEQRKALRQTWTVWWNETL